MKLSSFSKTFHKPIQTSCRQRHIGMRQHSNRLILLGIANLLVVGSTLAGKPTGGGQGGEPLAPSNLGATAASSSQINLSWTDNAVHETAVLVERSVGNSTSYSLVATLPANTTSYANGGLSPSTTYNYRVQAYDSTATRSKQYSEYSNVASATTPAATANYTITTSSSPSGGGSTSGGGTYSSGSIATVSAFANSGYNFVNWTQNGVVVSTSSSYSFTVNTSRNLVANFSGGSSSYTITTSSSPSAGGFTSGGGTYSSGSIATVTAFANSGYNFVNWTENGNVVSTSSSYSFTVNANRNLVANFSGGSSSYTITTSSSPAGGGSTSGGGTYSSGSIATVRAFANSGYNFVNWTENGSVVSTSTSYSFTVSGNRALVANFSGSSSSYTITTSSSPSAGGITGGGGTYDSGAVVTVSCFPNSGYTFENWTDGGVVVSTSVSYSFTASANRNLVANFSGSSSSYTITTSSSPAAGGSTSGGGTYASGSTATVSASPSSGYSFVNWTENGVVVSGSRNYSFTVNGSRALVANFSGGSSSYTITTSSSPSAGGSTGGGGTYSSGSVATVTAFANSGYNFVYWTENGNVVSFSSTYSFTVSGNRTLVANFSGGSSSYTITTSSSPSSGGSTSGGGTYTSGSIATVTAFANSCYNFVNWTENGTVVSTSTSYSFTVSGNRNLVANFSQASYAIITSSSPSAGGSTSGGGTKTCGTIVTVLATPNGGYAFVNWTQLGTVVSTSASYTFTVTGGRTLVANFTSSTSYTITTSSSPSAGGSTSGGGNYTSGSSVTVTATPNSGYSFANWTENGIVVSSSSSYSFTAIGNRNLVANFTATTSSTWAKDIGGAATDMGEAVATDASGNIFVAGSFSGSVNFGGGTLISAGGTDIFVAKYSPSGTYIWAKRFGGTLDDVARAVAVDKFGDVAVAGDFNGTATIGVNTFTSLGLSDGFVLKLSGSSGAPSWSRQIGGLYASVTAADYGYAVATDPNSGDVVVAGQVAGAVDFGTGYVYTTSLAPDTFLAKYRSSDGAYMWAKTFNCLGQDAGRAVAVDGGGNIALAGVFSGSIDFGGGSLSGFAAGLYAGYAAKFSSAGSHIWSDSFGTAYGANAYGVAVDSSGNVAVTGSFTGPSNMSFGSLVQISNTSGYPAAYVAKLSSATGAGIWAKSFVADQYSGGRAVAMDGTGNVIVTGDFYNHCNFGGGNLTSAGSTDGFAAKYNLSGSYVWSKRFGGSGTDWSFGVTADPSGNVLLTGPTMGGDFNGSILTSAGSSDVFLLKLAP
jgi:hypothetical protein